MSSHLPECQRWFTDMPEPDECPACEMFRACEQRVLGDRDEIVGITAVRSFRAGLDAAEEAVAAYADETHQHVGIDKCWPENGDRCDITAALRVVAKRLQEMEVK